MIDDPVLNGFDRCSCRMPFDTSRSATSAMEGRNLETRKCRLSEWCSSQAHRLASDHARFDCCLNAATRSLEQAGIPQATRFNAPRDHPLRVDARRP
jgi:hypothetical protein